VHQNEITVNKNNQPLRLNVGYLYNKSIGTVRDIPVNLDYLEIDDLVIQNLESLVRLSRTREGLLLQVQASAWVQAICVRCLKEFFMPVEMQFEELYQFPTRSREETDLVLPDDGYIDLNSLYREYFILAMPIKSLCEPDCNGLCEICGTNLNESTCEHHLNPDLHSTTIVDQETA
jgi:uncharacterized protein